MCKFFDCVVRVRFFCKKINKQANDFEATLYGCSGGRLEQSANGHSFSTYIINFQKHAQDTSVLSFLLHWLTVSGVRTANSVRLPFSDSSHVTAPYKLSFYYYLFIIIFYIYILFFNQGKTPGGSKIK